MGFAFPTIQSLGPILVYQALDLPSETHRGKVSCSESAGALRWFLCVVSDACALLNDGTWDRILPVQLSR